MLRPYCGGELTPGTAVPHVTASSFLQPFSISFCGEENSPKSIFPAARFNPETRK